MLMNAGELQPLVSVIVLTYNRFDNIIRNLESIQEQEYEKIEIIIHDDGSDAFPAETIEQLLLGGNKKKDYRIERNPINLGTVKNYNAAVEKAKGEIIIPLSQDDEFCDSRSISRIVDFFIDTNCIVCTGRRRGGKTGISYPNGFDEELLKTRDINRILFRAMIRNFISGSTLYFRKNAIKDLGFYPIFSKKYVLLEDYPFVLLCLKNGILIEYIDEDVIYYGEDGVSGSEGGASLKLLKDETKFYQEEIIPLAKERVRSKATQKYIVFQKKKLDDAIRKHYRRHSFHAISYLLKNPDLVALMVFVCLRIKILYQKKDADSVRYETLDQVERIMNRFVDNRSIQEKRNKN